MNITQIEEIVKKLVVDVNAGSVNKDEFIYQLMAAYGHRKTTIGRIKSGERNLADVTGEVRVKRHIYFKHCQESNVLSDIDSMKKQPSVAREKIRFVIATDFNQFVAFDTRTKETLNIQYNDLGKHFDFFLYWAGIEKAVYKGENPADVKAAEKMGDLFDLIKADNFTDKNKDDTQALHNLNVFLTRLLFCFFAEDTGIFKQNQFSGELESHTKVDGSDVAEYLNRLFEVLNTPKDKRIDLPDYLANFEFVNGGLFADNIQSPRFSTKSRKMLIESGSELDWSDINPDIFGSMIQAVVHPDQRGGMGMHYTSVTNIMKVIEPLFLDDLYAEFENIEDNIDSKLKPSRLRKLHDRLAEIKIFDPACGSGNFLIIAFKELRKLEMEIIKRLQELDKNDNQDDLFGAVGLDSSYSRIKLSQFYGIELDDFAHEVAILSLWLAEHQMNVEFKAEFGECQPTLPLKQSGNIISENALRVCWSTFCTKKGREEIYVLGNPPYLGGKVQSASQKIDAKNALVGIHKYKDLDYISCWFIKAAEYIEGGIKAAFVTTSSICQGIHVPALWPKIFENNVEILFAYEPFKWSNNAKKNAGVVCSIIGLGAESKNDKFIFGNNLKRKTKFINAYLSSGSDVIVQKNSSVISKLPKMITGNAAYDQNHLMLSQTEKDDLLNEYPSTSKYLKRLMGSSEFLKGNKRWCLWIEDEDLEGAKKIPPIMNRIDKVLNYRISGGEVALTLANRPHQFRYRHRAKHSQILVPQVSSERREYIPIGYIDKDTVITHLAHVIYDPELYVFCILHSKMHMVWVRAISGRLGSGLRYSSNLCYNSFPVPEIDDTDKAKLSELAIRILSERETYPDRSIESLYDPDKMPNRLKEVHIEVDRTVELLYFKSTFNSDVERLSCLLNLYENMTGCQNA